MYINLFLLIVILSFDTLHGQEQFHREIISRPRKRIRRVRINRQTFEEDPLAGQRSAAAAVEDALLGNRGTQLLIRHLAQKLRQSGQLQKPRKVSSDRNANKPNDNPVAINYVDQYGRLVSSNPQSADLTQVNPISLQLQLSQQQQQPQVSQTQVTQSQETLQPQQIRYVDQYGNEVQQISQQQQHIPQLQNFQETFLSTPEGLVFQQQPSPQIQFLQQQQLIPFYPQPQPQQQFFHPQQLVGQIPEPLQLHFHQPIPAAVPVLAAPVVKKAVVPVAEPPPVILKKKTIVEIPPSPEVHILKQPVLPPAVFQKQIFALKNPPARVLTYSDLCTVYPYQRKLTGCVLKKAAIPELHHPDIQQVSQSTESEREQSQQSSLVVIKGGNSRAENIQAILGPQQKGDSGGELLPLDEAEEGASSFNRNVTVSAAIATKVAADLKQSTKASSTSPTLTIPRSTNINKVAVAGVVSTRKPSTRKGRTSSGGESKRNSSSSGSNSGRRRNKKGQKASRGRKNSTTTSTTTTEKPFKLA